MRIALYAAFAALCALPATAQDYYGTVATARHGNGYAPAAIVAGWERDTSFFVLAIAPDGERAGSVGVGLDWKATLTTGPKAAAEDDGQPDDRYLDLKPAPKRVGPALPPVPRSEVIYSSRTCPAVVARMEALKPLAGFEFDPPALTGNQDGPNGDGHEGFDLWMRIGPAELNKSAGTEQSALGRWFNTTLKALAACPAATRSQP
jgi:hypothetical protein